MGKGDRKTRRGKITLGSYGVRRPRKKKKNTVSAVASKSESETVPSEVNEIEKKKTTTNKKTTSKKTTKNSENTD